MLHMDIVAPQNTDEEEEVFEEAQESPVQSDVEISLHALTGIATG